MAPGGSRMLTMAVAASCGWMLAQEVPAFTTGVNLVLLEVGVTSNRGEPISGLTEHNFKVRDEGRVRELSHFAPGSSDISVAVVVDFSASMRGRREPVLQGVETFISLLEPSDELSLVAFNDTSHLVQPAQSVHSLELLDLRAAITKQPTTGRTALYDSIQHALGVLVESDKGRRVVVVLSDGDDNQSRMSRRSLEQELEARNVLLFCIGLFEPGDPDTNAGALRDLAAITGGTAVFHRSPAQLPATFTRILRDIRARYVLAFRPELPQAGSSATRKVDVEARDADGRKLNVRYRKHYRVAGNSVPSNN